MERFGTKYFGLVSNFTLALPMASFSLLLAQFCTYSISVVSTFAFVLFMAAFSLNLAQLSTYFISLVSTFFVFAISITRELQYVLQYIDTKTKTCTANKN